MADKAYSADEIAELIRVGHEWLNNDYHVSDVWASKALVLLEHLTRENQKAREIIEADPHCCDCAGDQICVWSRRCDEFIAANLAPKKEQP